MKFLLTQNHMGLEISKRYSYSFHWIWTNFMRNMVVIWEYKGMHILANCQNLNILWHFEMLTGVNGKKLRCGIYWKQLMIEWNGWQFGTWGTTVHIGMVLLMPDSLILIWGHSVHFAKFAMLRFSKGYYSPSFHSMSTKFYCKYFDIFVYTEPYVAGNFKTLLLLQFSWPLPRSIMVRASPQGAGGRGSIPDRVTPKT